MAFLRDVIARFQVQVDTKPLTDLDKKLDKARKQVNVMGAAFSVAMGAAAYGVAQFTEAASDADETLAALKVVFDQNTDSVLDWSRTIGKEMGRSQYALQKAAQQFGAFLDPIFKNTDADISSMSTHLSELAVDLASFYNTSDEEAQMRLFSGISGETEAVRRLGIDISDSSLKELHKQRGGKGQYKSLSMAEKTQLRYLKILEDTTNAQGNAKKEAQGWAGSIKRLQGMWNEFSVDIGRRFKEILLPLVHEVEAWVPKLEKLVKESDLLGSAFRLAVITAGTLASAYVLLNAAVVANTALLAGTLLLFEDFNVFLEGGTSVIGDFITIMTGVQNPVELWNRSTNRMVGYLDMLASAISDTIDFILFYTTFGVQGDNEWDDLGAAQKRAGAMDENRAGVEAGLLKQRQDAAAKSDWAAFAETYKGRETLTSDQLTERAKQFRREALAAGATATRDDVASGLVSQHRLVNDGLRKNEGMVTKDVEEDVNQLATERAAIAFNINIEKLGDLKPEEAKRVLEYAAREAAAILREER